MLLLNWTYSCALAETCCCFVKPTCVTYLRP